jgi:hypothetical protein
MSTTIPDDDLAWSVLDVLRLHATFTVDTPIAARLDVCGKDFVGAGARASSFYDLLRLVLLTLGTWVPPNNSPTHGAIPLFRCRRGP